MNHVLGGGVGRGPLQSIENIRRKPKLLGRWQQLCGISLSVLQQLVHLKGLL